MSRTLAVGLVGLLLFIVPTGASQSSSQLEYMVYAPATSEPIAPDQSTTIEAILAVRCEPGTAAPSDPLSFALLLEFADEFEHGVTYPETVSVTVPRATCLAGQTVRETIPINLTLSMLAPAGEPVNMTLTALEAGGRYAATSWDIIPAATPSIEASVRHDRLMSGPQTPVEFPVDFVNRGNVPSYVSIHIPADAENQLTVSLPPRVFMPPGRAESVLVSVLTPFETGNNHRVDDVHLEVRWTDDKGSNETLEPLTVEITTKGMYLAGPAAIWTALIIVGVAARGRQRLGSP